MPQSWSWVTFSKPNPNQPTKVFTRPNPTHHRPKTLYNNCYTSQTSSTSQQSMTAIIQLQYSLTDSRVFHDVKNITQSSLHTSQTSSTSQQSMTAIIQLQYSLTDSRVFHDVKNITQSSLHPPQPNPPKIKKKLWPNPTQPNPWMDPTHDQLWYASTTV